MAARGRSRLKDVVDYTVRSLVREPEGVQVREIWNSDDDLVLKVTTEQPDMGKVIGKQGRTARAMRTILGAASTKIRKRSVLEILE